MNLRTQFLILAAVTTLGLAACGTSPYTLSDREKMTADLGAREFSERLGAKFNTCSGIDSDRDGYVSCSGTKPNNDTVKMLCSYGAKGCKDK